MTDPDAPLGPELRKALEAILMVVEEPVDVVTLAQVLEESAEQVEQALRALRASYVDEGRGFVLREVGGGWRLYTDPGAAEYVERFVLNGRSGRLSQAALETLAVVAYQQPVTRARIGEIRGVEADGAVCSLQQRGLVAEVGRSSAPGQPLLYGTTAEFLERLGLNSLEELPHLAELSPPAPVPPEPALGEYRRARREMDAGGPEEPANEPDGEAGDVLDAGYEQALELPESDAGDEAGVDADRGGQAP